MALVFRGRFRSYSESSLSVVSLCLDLRERFRGDLDVLGVAACDDVDGDALALFFRDDDGGVGVTDDVDVGADDGAGALASTLRMVVASDFLRRILMPTVLSLS